MTPLQRYYQKIKTKAWHTDSAQEAAMQQLQVIYEALILKKKWPSWRKRKLCQGLYLWGEVGRGKTQLMDLFYETLPVPKLRMHFHAFMRFIHESLTQAQGKINPLRFIAHQLAKQTRILCLDEFLVHEISDAMLLGQLLAALFDQGLILVTTANTPPEKLYEKGLQRTLFLPAIALLTQHLSILHLQSAQDYRNFHAMTANDSTSVTLVMSQEKTEWLFHQFTKEQSISQETLWLHGHPIMHRGYTHQLIWFDFESICSVPRSQIDYLTLVKRFSTFFITNVHPIYEEDRNRARLFIHLIDICYDANTQLFLISDQTWPSLYEKGDLAFEFKRTQSRLIAFKEKADMLLAKFKSTSS
jgi:cell division protein ZapE